MGEVCAISRLKFTELGYKGGGGQVISKFKLGHVECSKQFSGKKKFRSDPSRGIYYDKCAAKRRGIILENSLEAYKGCILCFFTVNHILNVIFLHFSLKLVRRHIFGLPLESFMCSN